MSKTTARGSASAGPETTESPATPDTAPALDAGRRQKLSNRAQARGTNLVGLIIGIVVAAIVGIAVGIPVIEDVISSANLTGTTALIVGFIPVMIGLMIFVATASPIMRRV